MDFRTETGRARYQPLWIYGDGTIDPGLEVSSEEALEIQLRWWEPEATGVMRLRRRRMPGELGEGLEFHDGLTWRRVVDKHGVPSESVLDVPVLVRALSELGRVREQIRRAA